MMHGSKLISALFSLLFITACGGGSNSSSETSVPSQALIPEPLSDLPPIEPIPESTPPALIIRPALTNLAIQQEHPLQYKMVEWTLQIDAEYNNPFDQRQIDLTASFTQPDGRELVVKGFWDGESHWRIRLNPAMAGNWQYMVQVEDQQGVSEEVIGTFLVAASSHKGWLQTGHQFNQTYSRRYLVHHDGSAFYGVGHCDAFSIFSTLDFTLETTRLINNMNEAGENYVLWWPQFYFSVVENDYNNYSLENLQLIDGVLDTLEQDNKFVIFTVWDHSQLRDNIHPWANGNWFNTNGFSRLLPANDFFTDNEAWIWQENLYRYMIARWGHSNALAMWHTVSEVNGTNAFDNTNTWHAKINEFFENNDPYQHLTTASKSGDQIWNEGNRLMGVPQVHVYQDLLNSLNSPKAKTIETAQVIASYTETMWLQENKPNWIGEFGVQNAEANHYPELFHNAIWSALGAGAALTPAEWNDFDTWGVMTPEMKNHMRFLSEFVTTTPLAQWDPQPLQITSSNVDIRGWGIAGEMGGLVWIQDASLRGLEIDEIRQQTVEQSNVLIHITGLTTGRYQISPYNTWQGTFNTSFNIECNGDTSTQCTVLMPTFTHDIALRINRLTP